MERLEGMAMAPLGLVDKFQQDLKTILDEPGLLASEMMNRVNALRERIREECEVQGDAFEREAQEVEKELLRKMEHLNEIRERGLVVRRAIEAMFRPS